MTAGIAIAEIALTTKNLVRCGNTATHMDQGIVHHHGSVAQVKLCFHRGSDGLESVEEALAAAEYAAEWAAENGEDDEYFDADAAYERHLETNERYAYEADMDEQRAAWGLSGGF